MDTSTPSLEDCFSEQGLIDKVMESFESRKEQIGMAHAVQKALDEGQHLIAEAGTGIGKSLAYLLPCALWAVRNKKKVIVATYTKALQEQLVSKDLPIIKKVLQSMGISFRYSLMMGADNYLCLQRLHRSMVQGEELFSSEEASEVFGKLLQWSEGAGTGLRMRIPFKVRESIWQRVCRDPDLCLGRKGTYADVCLYRKDLARAKKADLVVLNQHLFFSAMPLFDYGALVIDEAHNLDEMVTHFLGFSLSNRKIKRLLNEIYNPVTGRGILQKISTENEDWMLNAHSYVNEAYFALKNFFEEIIHQFGHHAQSVTQGNAQAIRHKDSTAVPDILSPPLEEVAQLLSQVSSRIQNDELSMEVRAYSERCRQAATQLKTFISCQSKDCAYWIESDSKKRDLVLSLNMAPLDVSGILKNRLFEGTRPIILTSATLSVDKSFKLYRQRIGLEECLEKRVDSPFNFAEQVVFYTDQNIPDPRRDPEAYEQKIIGRCLDIAEFVPGGIFVLFTNWKLLDKTYEVLKDSIKGREIFKQGDKLPYQMLDDFKKARNGLLLGTETFWQGVDVPGQALSCVVITRLPFSSPYAPLEEARNEWLESQDIDAFKHYSLPKAVIRFRQGFGRLIRAKTDRGAVVVLDPRVKTKVYGSIFLRSIPNCKVVKTFDELRNFFESKKLSSIDRGEKSEN